MKNDTSITNLQKAQKIRALDEETNPQVQAILSPKQFQQLQGIRRQELEDMIQKKRATQQ
jgi:predicted component of type VI protein secretion system